MSLVIPGRKHETIEFSYTGKEARNYDIHFQFILVPWMGWNMFSTTNPVRGYFPNNHWIWRTVYIFSEMRWIYLCPVWLITEYGLIHVQQVRSWEATIVRLWRMTGMVYIMCNVGYYVYHCAYPPQFIVQDHTRRSSPPTVSQDLHEQ